MVNNNALRRYIVCLKFNGEVFQLLSVCNVPRKGCLHFYFLASTRSVVSYMRKVKSLFLRAKTTSPQEEERRKVVKNCYFLNNFCKRIINVFWINTVCLLPVLHLQIVRILPPLILIFLKHFSWKLLSKVRLMSSHVAQNEVFVPHVFPHTSPMLHQHMYTQ